MGGILNLSCDCLTSKKYCVANRHLPVYFASIKYHAKSLLFVALTILLPVTVSGQVSQDGLQNLLINESLQGAWVGVIVQTVNENPKTLLKYNDDKRFMPASNAKLFVSALALERLGEDFSFSTPVLTDGEVKGEMLLGNLYLRGVGDPSLTCDRFEELVKNLKAQGIRLIKGNIVVDVSAFTDNRFGVGWAWDYLQFGYAPEVWSLALDRNSVIAQIIPSESEFSHAKVTVTSLIDWFIVDNQIQTIKSGQANFNVWREAWERTLHFWGSIPLASEQKTIRLSVSSVPHYIGSVIKHLLQKEGIEVHGDVQTSITPNITKTLYEMKSKPLRELVRWMNKVSDNLYAEMILRTISLKEQGCGSAEASLAILNEQLQKWGIEPLGVALVDGSGLSRRNMVTPRAVVNLLQIARRRPWFESFYESFPIAGSDGTLANRFRNTPAEKQIFAKTGFISGVVALSGYLKRNDGSELVFSVLVNNFSSQTQEVQKAVDNFLISLL